MSEKQIELKINPEYVALLPPLSQEEYEALKESIRNEGLHYPISVNQDKVILDGHHRYNICRQLGITPHFETVRFEGNKLSEKQFVIETNLRRRHLCDLDKAALALELEKVEAEWAKQRMIVGKTLSSNELGVKGQARDTAAHKVGLSPTTYHRAKTILEQAPENLKEKVRQGKTSITHAYMQIKKTENDKSAPPLPQGQFDIIYVDPPWKYDVWLRGRPEDYYPTMTIEEICNLEIPASKNSVLFLWATNPMLEDALKVMNTWGFTYKTNLVWVKDKIGLGFYFRGQHELLLVGIKGDIRPPEESDRFPSVLSVSVGFHSEKPFEVYEIIEKMYPNGRYLELFARNKRENWASWGNQI